jgi:multiple sugar transport system permease protein
MATAKLLERGRVGKAAPARTRSPGRPGLGRRIEPFLLLAPSLILVGLLAGYPLVRSIWFSVNEANPFQGAVRWVGAQNFTAIVDDPHFGAFVGHSLTWTLGAVALQLVFGTLGALLLNARFRLRGAFRALAMIPWATPSVLVALMWLWILDPNHGILNAALQGLGIIDHPVAWLSRTDSALPTLIAVDVWQGVPFFAVMVLAALQAVPAELKEAASIDGCGRWGVFRHVVVPAILPTVLITTLLRVIWTANYIDLAFILTGGGPGTATTTLPLQSYLTAYKGADFGQGSAYAVVQALVLTALIVVYVRLVREERT